MLTVNTFSGSEYNDCLRSLRYPGYWSYVYNTFNFEFNEENYFRLRPLRLWLASDRYDYRSSGFFFVASYMGALVHHLFGREPSSFYWCQFMALKIKRWVLVFWVDERSWTCFLCVVRRGLSNNMSFSVGVSVRLLILLPNEHLR